VRRNALVVLGNSGAAGDARVEATLRRYLGHPSPMLREHAAWAAARLGLDRLVTT
jgi:epoxyqueuosine reductase QueG